MSCGILAINALVNYFHPEWFPLIQKEDVAEGRLRTLKLIVDVHEDEVSVRVERMVTKTHCTLGLQIW